MNNLRMLWPRHLNVGVMIGHEKEWMPVSVYVSGSTIKSNTDAERVSYYKYMVEPFATRNSYSKVANSVLSSLFIN